MHGPWAALQLLPDGGIDDDSFMIPFLLYLSDFDVTGMMEVNSKFQKIGHRREPWPERQGTDDGTPPLTGYQRVVGLIK